MDDITDEAMRSVRFHEQFHLNEHGLSAGEANYFGYVELLHSQHLCIQSDIQSIIAKDGSVTMRELMPEWNEQTTNLMIPCRGTRKYFWGKVGHVSSLPEFLEHLSKPTLPSSNTEGLQINAARMYWGYLHQTPVSSKRWKDPPIGARAARWNRFAR